MKRIAVGSFYISLKSRYKAETIEHIIQNIHIIRAKYESDVQFLLGCDFNRVDIGDILESYGTLKQIISVSTQNSATLKKSPLTSMGVLAPRSAHARPSARPPINMSGYFPVHVSEESPSNISPSP